MGWGHFNQGGMGSNIAVVALTVGQRLTGVLQAVERGFI